MLLEVYRCRRRAAVLGGTALLALLNALPSASAQEQAPTNPPAQTQAPQESTPPSPSPQAPSAPQESTPPSPSPQAPSVQAPSTPAPTPSPQISGGGTQLPQINIQAARRPAPRPAPRAVARRPAPPTTANATVPPVSPAEVLTQKSNSLDQARSNLFTTIGTTSDTISHDTIEALPQGANASVERVLLNAPGVSQDSAASGLLHVRTITPMCNSVSTACFCLTASPASAAFSTLSLSAVFRSSLARFPPNTGCARSASSTSPRATTFSTIPAASITTSAAGRGSSRASNMAAPLAPIAQARTKARARPCRPKRRQRHP